MTAFPVATGRGLDIGSLREAMRTSPGHRPDTGSSTQLVRLPVLSVAESNVVADLLTHLAETGHPQTAGLAAEMATRLRDRIGL